MDSTQDLVEEVAQSVVSEVDTASYQGVLGTGLGQDAFGGVCAAILLGILAFILLVLWAGKWFVIQ